MKKIIIILMAVMLMISSASLAEDLSSLPDADLLQLYRQASIELESRGIDPGMVYPEDAFSGDDLWTKDLAGRLEMFFGFWNASDIPNMLTVCSSGWKTSREDPGTDLLMLLGDRTPTDFEVVSVSREPADFIRIVSLIAGIDQNDGNDPAKYVLRVSMMKDADGLWYIDPGSMETFEYMGSPFAEPAPGPAEEAMETSENTVLYYSPEGGQYYHADQNCGRVNVKFLPLGGSFTYGELEDEAYKDLLPCGICGAPARPVNRNQAVSFRDAVDAAGDMVTVGGDIDYLAAVTEKNGKYIRMVTLPDDHARELYMAAMGAEDSGEAYEAFQAYAWSLPVTYTEEITARPKDQAELDALAGKTVDEITGEGYSIYGSGGGEGLPTFVDLSNGLFNYEFEIDASFEEYLERMDRDDLGSLTVKSGKHSGFSSLATDLDYLADGTCEPQVVPHITAEEAAAAEQIPPAGEYTAGAWPVTAEGYSDLLNNMEARFGQVYLVEGVVHQVLSRSPLTAVVNTGADGKSQPVIIEYHGQPGFSPEEGDYCRIYADVTSSCYILPVLTARYTFSESGAGTADEPAPAD